MLGKGTLGGCAALLILAGGCRDVTSANPAAATLLVSNATCASGACTAYHVLAFPVNQPETPGGYWSLDLGTLTTASACVTIPASASFTITDVSTGARTVLRWTTANGVSMGLVAAGDSRIMAAPSTGTFVPARAAGWHVALPGTATPTPAAPCQ